MEPVADTAEMVGGEGAPAEVDAEARFERLNALGLALSTKRKEAIEARLASGIEAQWDEDQEFYEGIDDANREESRFRDTKPAYQGSSKADKGTVSTVFPNITAPYCDAAAARVADMLLPTDDRSWSLGPTPIPELEDMAHGEVPAAVQQQALNANGGNPEAAKTALTQAVERAMAVMLEAKRKAAKAEKRIEDWMVECQWHAEVRKVIEDAARLGSGVVKGPEPVVKRSIAFKDNALVVIEAIKPGSKRINPWDLFPDGACGDNIHNGAYVFERDRLTAKGLQKLKGSPGYIAEQIDAVVEEGPIDAVALAHDPDAKPDQKKKRFEVWYFYGAIDREDMESAGCECAKGMTQIPAIITMVNNRVIRAALNPLDTGDYPYDVIPWQKKEGMPWGDGVARKIRTPQRIVTSATRAMLTNAGRAAGPIIVWKQGVVEPADGVYSITPWKILYVGRDADIEDVNKAVGVIKIPILQAELERIIQIGLKLAEDVTGLPLILQGQQGKAPDTVGGLQILNDNASAVLRRMARTFDDYITEPHVRRYYAWLLQYGEDDEKGDYCIDARGSSALVERSLQAQEMAGILSASANPIYGIDPKKTMAEFLKSRKFDPVKFEFDDEKWQQIVENMAKGPSDPRLAVAQLRAEVEQRLQQAEQAFKASEGDKDRNNELMLAAIEAELGQAGLSVETRKSLETVKGKLAETLMKVRAQKELSAMGAAKEALKPPTEPKGRAPNGQSFQR